MAGNKINAQNQFVKECLFDALMILMEKKSFSRITVTELTQKAGVSRMAYYRNYIDKDEIINDYLDGLFEDYSEELEKHKNLNINQNTFVFFQYFRKQTRLINNLINSNMTTLLLERFNKYLPKLFHQLFVESPFSPEEERYQLAYTAGGFFNVLIAWLANGMKESDEEMAAIVQHLYSIQSRF